MFSLLGSFLRLDLGNSHGQFYSLCKAAQALKERDGHKILNIKSFSSTGISVPSSLGLWEHLLACDRAVLWLFSPFQLFGA